MKSYRIVSGRVAKAAAVLVVLLAATLCRSQYHPTNMATVDVLKLSGVAEVERLADEFRRTSDTNALARLCAIVADPKRNARGAGTLASLAPHLTPTQIQTFVVPALIKGLQNPRTGARRECAMTLSQQFAEFAQPAIPTLAKLLPGEGDDPMNASIYAAETLGKIGPAAALAIPNLLKTLEQPESQPEGYKDLSVRVRAVEAIGRIGLPNQYARERVEKALSDSNPYIRAKSAQVLLRSGGDTQRAVETIVQLMQADDVEVRRFTLRTLEETGSIPDSLRTALLDPKEDPDPDVQMGLHKLLGTRRP
jgi:hypothetical protein